VVQAFRPAHDYFLGERFSLRPRDVSASSAVKSFDNKLLYSPTIGGARWGWTIVMASIFGDESADETAQRVFAVAGVIGTDSQWDDLVNKWTERTGGKGFHATECETEYADDPDATKHKENLRLYADLSKLIAASELHGWGVAVDLAGYREFFPEVDQQQAFHKCFVETSDRLVQTASAIGYKDLKFTFDHRQGEHNTGVLYDLMTSQPEWASNIFFDNEISFTSRTNPRIQVADLVARETMKGLDNHIGPVKRPHRKSLVALATTNKRFQFDFLMREYFEDMKRKMPKLIELAGFSDNDYFKWLQKNKLANNLTSRFRFLVWFEAQELRKEKE
jgi:hypothetical protein